MKYYNINKIYYNRMDNNYILTSNGYIETTREIGWVRDGDMWKADYKDKLEWYLNKNTGFWEERYKNYCFTSSYSSESDPA